MPTAGSQGGRRVQAKAKGKAKAKSAAVVKMEEPKTADEIRAEMRDLAKYRKFG